MIEYILGWHKVSSEIESFCLDNLPEHVDVRFESGNWLGRDTIYITSKNPTLRKTTFSWQVRAGVLTAVLDQNDLWPNAVLFVRHSSNLLFPVGAE